MQFFKTIAQSYTHFLSFRRNDSIMLHTYKHTEKRREKTQKEREKQTQKEREGEKQTQIEASKEAWLWLSGIC